MAEMALERQRSRRLAGLYSEHAPRAGRLAYLLVGDRDLAEDIVQEAFVRVAARLWTLRNPEAFEAYLRQTVLNLTRGHMRRVRRERAYLNRQRNGRHEEVQFPDLPGRDELFRMLNNLPYRQRAAIVLRYYGDHSEQQTADLLGCPVGTVKSLVSRGLKMLREQMRGED
jgi:RNA polymerase sigma-70 factor (sigma-E family)